MSQQTKPELLARFIEHVERIRCAIERERAQPEPRRERDATPPLVIRVP